jgi:hypothetical protein
VADFTKILKDMATARAEGDPISEVLGVIPSSETKPEPQGPTTTWATASGGSIGLDEPPPPWELEDQDFTPSDARRFIDAPANIALRWMNPKFIEASGWRYWSQVSLGDGRFKLKVDQMLMPDGTIRRGGPTGDILAWMYRSWADKLRIKHQHETDKLTQSARDRFEETKNDIRRGKYGPHVTLEEGSSRPQHPTHTMADGRSMKD